MQNGDPFCGGDYQFCSNQKELKDCLSYNYVFHIYKLYDDRDLDLLDYFLEKFKNSYNNHCGLK